MHYKFREKCLSEQSWACISCMAWAPRKLWCSYRNLDKIHGFLPPLAKHQSNYLNQKPSNFSLSQTVAYKVVRKWIHDTIHVSALYSWVVSIGIASLIPRPPAFFCSLVCIDTQKQKTVCTNTNQRTKNGEGLGTRLGIAATSAVVLSTHCT